jgi:CMP-N,N'-diacetyllegionaminic acid synthase
VISGLSVLALITARGGSKGVPGKNVLPIGGKPLIAWTIDAARGSRYVDRMILSSEDAVIIDAARRHGCEAPFVRDAALATDTATSIDVVADALHRVPGYDVIVLLQPTSPLRNSADIDATVECLISSGAPACVTVRPAQEHPYWTFQLNHTDQLARFVEPIAGMPLRRQDLPEAWCLNGAVYAARTEWFMRERTFLSPLTVGHRMPDERSLDIDTPADVERLRSIVDRVRLPTQEISSASR